MPSLGKRSAAFVDLTNSDDENPPRKHPRSISSTHASSQPTASQSLNVRDQWAVGDDDGDEIIGLGQDVDEGFGWTILGALNSKIVGIRYYDGFATPGEQVMIKREPGNPYDSNAIRINNVQGTQIGHLPRNLASKLASYLVSNDPALFLKQS